jgi:MFS family permease
MPSPATTEQTGRDLPAHTRWNFAMIVMESSAFQTGIAWTDPATVLPLFIGLLSKSTVLVGLVTVLQRLGWILPQMPMAAIVGHRPRRRPYLRWGVFIGRLPFLAFVAYVWTHRLSNPGVVLTFMLLAYFSVALGNGVVAVPWQDIIAKSIPSGIRGRFFGAMQFLTGLAIFGVGFAVRWMLGPRGPGEPTSYFVLFTLAAVFITWSTVGCWLIKEPIRPVRERPHSLRELLTGIGPLVRSHPSLLWVGLVALLGWGLAGSTPFYMVFARSRLDVPAQIAGVYIWAATLGGATFSIIWAHFNDTRGPRSVIRGTCIALTVAPLLALLVPAVAGLLVGTFPGVKQALPYLFAVVFLATGATMPGMWMGTNNYLLELTSHEDRPRYIAVFNTLALPGAVLPVLVGALLEAVPFRLVFGLMALCGAAALMVAWRMPRPGIRSSSPG